MAFWGFTGVLIWWLFTLQVSGLYRRGINGGISLGRTTVAGSDSGSSKMLICRIDKAIKNLHEALPAKYNCHLNRQITLTLTPR